jgi:hypothetical protein
MLHVFFVRARCLEAPDRWRTAHVVAGDDAEALLLLKKSVHFWGYEMPPVEMRVEGGEPDARRVGGARACSEKGVFRLDAPAPVPG